jgi:hypothetical protein
MIFLKGLTKDESCNFLIKNHHICQSNNSAGLKARGRGLLITGSNLEVSGKEGQEYKFEKAGGRD